MPYSQNQRIVESADGCIYVDCKNHVTQFVSISAPGAVSSLLSRHIRRMAWLGNTSCELAARIGPLRYHCISFLLKFFLHRIILCLSRTLFSLINISPSPFIPYLLRNSGKFTKVTVSLILKPKLLLSLLFLFDILFRPTSTFYKGIISCETDCVLCYEQVNFQPPVSKYGCFHTFGRH